MTATARTGIVDIEPPVGADVEPIVAQRHAVDGERVVGVAGEMVGRTLVAVVAVEFVSRTHPDASVGILHDALYSEMLAHHDIVVTCIILGMERQGDA